MEGVRGMQMVKGKSQKKKPTFIPLVNIHKRNPLKMIKMNESKKQNKHQKVKNIKKKTK